MLKLAVIQGVFYLATGQNGSLVDENGRCSGDGDRCGAPACRQAPRVTDEIVLLAVGSALGLAAIDVIYAVSGRISAVYLADAVVEVGLALLWLVAWRRAT